MANGLFAGGNGTEGSPYLIEDAHDLNAVRNGLGKHYKLINDIDLNVSPYNEGGGWAIISGAFTGVLDGQGYTVDGLFINKNIDDSTGAMFYRVNGTVQNVSFTNVSIENPKGACSTIALLLYGTIQNCMCEGMVSGKYALGTTSGISGSVETGGKVERCVNKCKVTSHEGRVGGIAGVVRAGGLIANCYNQGEIIGDSSFNSVAYVGGVAGLVFSGGSVKNSYSTGVTRMIGTNGSGIVGLAYAQTPTDVANSFWDKEASLITTSAGGTGLTTIQAKTPQTFIDAGWNTEVLPDGTTKVWVLKDGEYPKLWFEYNPLSKILIKDSTGKIISRSTDSLSWVDTLETTITGTSFEAYGMESDIVSSLTSADWNSLYDDVNFTAPFEFQVFKEEDVVPVLTETTTENEFGVIARSFEVEIDETELEKVRNLVVQ